MVKATWLTGAAGLALALAGCNQKNATDAQALTSSGTPLPALPAALPLSNAPATPIRPAPAVNRLAAAPPLAWGAPPPGDDYAWIDRAYWLSDAVGDAPPDWGFDYDGVDPWAWRSQDGYQLVAEPIDDGYRYYYYEPGSDEPFLVRDPDYAYAYSGRRVVAVYDRAGRFLAGAAARARAEAAARYYSRGDALFRASQDRGRHGVIAANWAARRPLVERARLQWTNAAQAQPGWLEYRRRTNGREQQHWGDDARRRAQAAQQFADWQSRGFQGTAPALDPRAQHGEGPDHGGRAGLVAAGAVGAVGVAALAHRGQQAGDRPDFATAAGRGRNLAAADARRQADQARRQGAQVQREAARGGGPGGERPGQSRAFGHGAPGRVGLGQVGPGAEGQRHGGAPVDDHPPHGQAERAGGAPRFGGGQPHDGGNRAHGTPQQRGEARPPHGPRAGASQPHGGASAPHGNGGGAPHSAGGRPGGEGGHPGGGAPHPGGAHPGGGGGAPHPGGGHPNGGGHPGGDHHH